MRSLLPPEESTDKEAGGPLPVGVGFVLFSDCAAPHFGETTVPILARHRPAAVWFFAPDPDGPETLRRVIEALCTAAAASAVDWNPRVVVQVGTVAAARQAAELGADVIVAQGAEAGGHQFVRAAGLVSLVPEVRDSKYLIHWGHCFILPKRVTATAWQTSDCSLRHLPRHLQILFKMVIANPECVVVVRNEFADREIAVWAAGGIADGRGVAAALALGAEAAVLGTRVCRIFQSAPIRGGLT